ncbi:cold-shock protein [Bacillus manliponensis]|uniref:cold-shock protein n=1 Tax=Bacillus manliponensis TaxID=574376 RepID=UPI00351583A5
MYRNKKNDVTEVAPEQVPVWECGSEECLGWMRKNFSFEEEPTCPLCGSEMTSGERLLPRLG